MIFRKMLDETDSADSQLFWPPVFFFFCDDIDLKRQLNNNQNLTCVLNVRELWPRCDGIYI